MNLLPFFAAGLAASVHCVGMCGGIAAMLGGAAAGRPQPGDAAAPPVAAPMGAVPPAPIPPAAAQLAAVPRAAVPLVAVPLVFHARATAAAATPVQAAFAMLPRLARIASFNAGRIASYMVAGAAAGGVARGVTGLAAVAPLQMAALVLANLMLLATGLYLMNAWRGLAHAERAGQYLWRHVQPMLRSVMPIDTPAKALAAGALWGWLPCGLVYSMLVTAMLSGDGVSGAAIMLAFGLGTAPLLFAAGLAGMRLRGVLQRRAVRIACGGVVAGFGVLGLLRAAGTAIPGLPALHGWADALCIGGM